MGKKSKLKLNDLEVQSFITAGNAGIIKGGTFGPCRTILCASVNHTACIIACPGSSNCANTGCPYCPPNTGASVCLCSGIGTQCQTNCPDNCNGGGGGGGGDSDAPNPCNVIPCPPTPPTDPLDTFACGCG